MNVAVVGAGVNGLAAADALARAGARVDVYEQFAVGHDRGSSHGASRIFRLAYREQEWVRLAQEAAAGWAELEAESGETLIERTGLVEITADEASSSLAALAACGVAGERITAHPQLALPDAGFVVFQPDAGIIRADLALAALRASAERHGAAIHEHRRIGRLDELEADSVIVTAGAWASGLLAAAGIELPVVVTRETVSYFAHPPGPPSLIEYGSPRGDAYYALSAPGIGLKAGIHHADAHDDPRQEGRADPELVELTRAWVAERFPGAGAESLKVETCLYTCTVDERFVLERHGAIVVGSACSGHGFKFAPAVGRRLAELALS